jgi:hypothetical protein
MMDARVTPAAILPAAATAGAPGLMPKSSKKTTV